MSTSKNALMLFCKPPIPGLVKTRLTTKRGGALTEQEAADFFKCCLLDMTELSLLALDDLEQLNVAERSVDSSVPLRTYEFVVSTTPYDSMTLLSEMFEQEGNWSREIAYTCDVGASFDDHFDNAFEQLFSRGNDNVVAIGGDHPTMTREHIVEAFLWLDYLAGSNEQGLGFVQSACQESGVSIVGQTKNTMLSSQGVYYNRNGRPVLDTYTEILRAREIPNAFLSPVSDVDTDTDLAHAISCINAMAEASYYQTELFVPHRVLKWIDDMSLESTAPPNEEHDPRHYIDVPVYDSAS